MVHCPQTPLSSKQTLRDSSGSLKERTEEPLGNLNKVYRAHFAWPTLQCVCECTSMHEWTICLWHTYQSDPQSRTLPGDGPTWAYLPYLPLQSEARRGEKRSASENVAMHRCVCSNQCNKKGGCAVRAVVTVAPHCTARQDR